MRLTRRAATLLVFLIPAAFISVMGGLMLARYVRAAEARSARVLAQTLSSVLDHEVTIASVQFSGVSIIAHDVRLAEGHTLRASGEMASAQRIVLNTSVRRLVDELRGAGPIHADAVIYGAHARVTRDSTGAWNFDDLFHRRPGTKPRAVVAHMRFVGASVEYVDARVPRLLAKPLPAIRASSSRVDGSLDLFQDGSVSWAADVLGSPSQFATGRVTGTYETPTGALHVGIDARDVRAISLAPYVLPKQITLSAGLASGHVSVLRTSRRDKAATTADLRLDGVMGHIARIDGPISALSGSARLDGGRLYLDLSGTCANSRLHASGSMTLTAPTIVDARFSASTPDLGSALAAISSVRRIDLPTWVHISGNAAGSLAGPLDAPLVDATGTVLVSGTPSDQVHIAAPVPIDFHFAGTPSTPRVYGSARIEQLRYRNTLLRKADVVASYDGKRWTADLRCRTSGGTLAARATLQDAPGSLRYRVVVRARQIELARAGLQTDRTLSGVASADVFMEGSGWAEQPEGQAIVEVSGLRYDRLELDGLRGSLRSTGRLLLVDSLVADGASGRVVASGEVDLGSHQADLNVEADRIDLAQIPFALNDARSTSLAGQVFLREGRVTGPIADPTFSAVITAIEPAVGRYRLDYAEARVRGDRHRATVANALLWRLPATATFDGELLEPLSGHGLVQGSGRFDNLDVQDAARMADVRTDAVGEASGDVAIVGPLRAPDVTVSPIVVAGAGLGDVTPGTVTGAVTLTGGTRLTASVDVLDVDLYLPNAPLSSYAVIEGMADLHAELRGILKDGAFSSLTGTVAATTRGLTLSGQSLGDLSASAELSDKVLTLRSSPDGTRPGARLGSADRGIDVTNLQLNLSTGDYMLGARGRGLPVDLLRAAVARSPFASSQSGVAITQWAIPLSEPFAGTIDLDVSVSGNGTAPAGWLAWSSTDLKVDGAPAKEFAGRVQFDGGAASINSAVLDTGSTSFAASGSYRPGKALSGNAVVKHLQLDRIAALFPARKALEGLKGLADEARITLDGTPDEPNVHISATLTDLPVTVQQEVPQPKNRAQTSTKSPASSAVTAPPAPLRALVKRIDIDDAYLVGGKVGVHEVVATLAGTDGTASEYTVSAAGSVDYDRKGSRVPPDARVSASVTLPEQDTGILKALRPLLKQYFPSLLAVDVEGRLSGSLKYNGLLTEWSDPQKAFQSGTILPDLRGDLTLLASRVRYADMRTILTDVDASVHFTGDRLVVGRDTATDRPFTATMAVLDPKTGKQDPTRRSDPIELAGELPLRPDVGNVSPLRLTAHRLVFAESVLPVFGSGSIAGEISAPPPPGRTTATEPGLALTLENTLLEPRISGTVHLRKTALRLPNALDESDIEAPVGLLKPSFANIKFQVDDQVRIATSAVVAEVRTPPLQPIVLSGDIRRPHLEGSLTINRGVLAFPTARFNISKGGHIDVRYPAYGSVSLDRPGQRLEDTSLSINVELTAVGQITATSASTGRPGRYTITVDAKGPLNSGQAIDVSDSDSRTSGGNPQRSLRLTFRSDPADLALTSDGLQRKITGALGGQDAIEGLFRSDPRLARLFGDQVLGVVSANVLPTLLDRVGLTEALGFQELALDYNQLEQFSIRLSRRLIGPFDISFWHRLGSRLTTTSERGLWEIKTSYRLGRGAQLSWTTNDQGTNATLLEGVYRF